MIGPQNRWVNHFMALQCMRAALRRNPPTMFFPWPAPPDHQHSGFLIVPIVKGAKAIKESWRKKRVITRVLRWQNMVVFKSYILEACLQL
jgi:hypothetical protein